MQNAAVNSDIVMTASQWRAAGATALVPTQVGKATKDVLFVPAADQPVKADGDVALKADPNSLREASAARAYTPRQAMAIILGNAAKDTKLPATQRNAALAWTMKNNSLERSRLFRVADSGKGMHMKKGQEALAKLSPQFINGFDQEVRLSLGQYAPKPDGKKPKLDASSIVKEARSKLPEINADTVKHVAVNSLRSPNGDSSLTSLANRLGAKTKGMAAKMQKGALTKLIGAGLEVMAAADPVIALAEAAIPAVPVPRARPRNAFALNS